jgi:aspartyl/asparaginyl-tRNA synthetase
MEMGRKGTLDAPHILMPEHGGHGTGLERVQSWKIHTGEYHIDDQKIE